MGFSGGHYIDMNIEVYPASLNKNALAQVQEYVIHGQHKKLFTYLAEQVR